MDKPYVQADGGYCDTIKFWLESGWISRNAALEAANDRIAELTGRQISGWSDESFSDEADVKTVVSVKCQDYLIEENTIYNLQKLTAFHNRKNSALLSGGINGSISCSSTPCCRQ